MDVTKKTVFLAAVLGLCLVTVNQGATYYIDFASGSDSNNGATKTTPWKRHPYMAGFGGRYSHTAGDQFIFKGGVTWPVTCFQMRIPTGGSTAAWDYYGADTTWFAGDAFARPLFDFQHTLIKPSGYYSASGVLIDGTQNSVGYITFDNLELANFRSVKGDAGQQTCSILMYVAVHDCVYTNLVVRDWDLAAPVNLGDDHTDSGGIAWLGGGAGGYGVKVSHCTLFQSGPVKSGTALRNLPYIEYTEVFGCPEVFLGAGTIHDCHFHNLPAPSDPLQHGNCIEGFGPCTIYNTKIHDLDNSVAPILIAADWTGGSGTSLIYNCVMWNLGWQRPIGMDTSGKNPAGIGMKVYNCTIEHGNNICVDAVLRSPGYKFALLDVENNHFITSGSPVGYNSTTSGTVASVTMQKNLVQTPSQAAVAGYGPGNAFSPIAGSLPTVGMGGDLSSVFKMDINNNPRSGAWDVGAYQYGQGAPIITPPPASPVNSAPIVSSIVGNLPNSSTTGNGYQVVEGATLTLSASISDPEGDAVSWEWLYSLNGGPVTSYLKGSGNQAAASFSCASGTAGNNYLWTLRASDGTATTDAQFSLGVSPSGSPPTPVTGGTVIVLDPTTGLVGAPMIVANGYVYQPVETDSLSDAGRSTLSFSVTYPGTYVVSGLVNAPNGGANSFWVNIDAEPQDPYSVWDVPITNGFEEHAVSWRGNGTWDAPALTPNHFELSAGNHTLVIVGREAGTLLKQITISKLPAPPQNLRIVINN